jgi:hypothetical protein
MQSGSGTDINQKVSKEKISEYWNKSNLMEESILKSDCFIILMYQLYNF